jgi:hypothetical protein
VTNHEAFLTLAEVAPLLGDAQIMTAVLSSLGFPRRVEAYGDKQRIFTENQRLAMAARDRGCTFPGCTSAPAYCEAHHVLAYTDDGRTSVDNGVLLCAYHHRSFEDLGYTCVFIDGVPHWIAPAWVDPTRTPQRNTAHDPSHGTP